MSLQDAIKSVPTPVLIGLGGGVIGLGYVAFKSRGDAAPPQATDPALVEATPVGDAYSGATYTSQVPSGIAYVGGQGPSGEDASSTVGAVGQTALDTLADITKTALGIAAKQPAQVDPDLIAAIAAGRQPDPTQQVAATIPLPQPPPPATPAKPPTTVEKLPAGYHPGNTVSEATHKKVFPGALGWARVDSGGTGKAHWIDYHIRFRAGKVQKWRYLPNVPGGRWSMTWHN